MIHFNIFHGSGLRKREMSLGYSQLRRILTAVGWFYGVVILFGLLWFFWDSVLTIFRLAAVLLILLLAVSPIIFTIQITWNAYRGRCEMETALKMWVIILVVALIVVLNNLYPSYLDPDDYSCGFFDYPCP